MSEATVSPFFVLVAREELVELLAAELELVLGVLLDGLLVRDRVVVGGQESLERHHGRLRRILLQATAGPTASSATAAAVAATARRGWLAVAPATTTHSEYDHKIREDDVFFEKLFWLNEGRYAKLRPQMFHL